MATDAHAEGSTMEPHTCRKNTRTLMVFWSLMVVYGSLTTVCIHLALGERNRP